MSSVFNYYFRLYLPLELNNSDGWALVPNEFFDIDFSNLELDYNKGLLVKASYKTDERGMFLLSLKYGHDNLSMDYADFINYYNTGLLEWRNNE